ncbi:MAG TPA: TIGR03435 family protein [Bryobacteraceae bacterium]|nr:TIGR03435 family protein [Bryobacteraceae bacterium]
MASIGIMWKSAACFVLITTFAGAAGPPAFDVASVKVSHAPDGAVLFGANGFDARSGKLHIPAVGGTVTMHNWSLMMLVVAAWDMGLNQVTGPSWLSTERYDIEAKTSPTATAADVRQMLQTLLAERFHLATHHETKETPAYALVVAKGGPKLQASKADQQLPVIFAPPARLIGQGSSMASLAMTLRRPAGRPVIDKTGLSGFWDFTLTYSPEENVTDQGPSIFTALQEQLGLRLAPDRSSADYLVVDHAERIPVPN